ncbi:YqaA family protein [Phreatobacter sp.]|uniref:YqaA family protein n=1 Tax=Phreatobacter sp. TaxID=1966341 RepID=UPI003F6FF14A
MAAEILALATMAAAAFTAATLLPGGSEVVFLGLMATGAAPVPALFVVAALANTAGGMTSWWIGRLIATGVESPRGKALVARFRLDPAMMTRVQRLFARHGWMTLLLCWMPVIGDPITLVAGMARYPALPTLIITGLARTARYAVLWAGAAGLIAWWG